MKTLYCVEFQRGTTTERITVRAASHAQAYRIALSLSGVTGEPDATITPKGGSPGYFMVTAIGALRLGMAIAADDAQKTRKAVR